MVGRCIHAYVASLPPSGQIFSWKTFQELKFRLKKLVRTKRTRNLNLRHCCTEHVSWFGTEFCSNPLEVFRLQNLFEAKTVKKKT